MRALLTLTLILLVAALPARAQAPAALVADRLDILAGDRLVATGNVEVLQNGTRLRAARVEYDRSENRLTIAGPITVTDASGALLTADSAELSADLRDGLLRGARLVLDQQLQMAANEVNRIGGRYTQLSHTVASSCRVCAAQPTPLWEIRARRVIHDQQERQIYFDSAQFRFAGVPVMWVPRLRMPDPTLTRATGFLMPSFVSSSRLGVGMRLPYFVKLGDSRDLTLTPFLATKNARSLGLRYRQAFRAGQFAIDGTLSYDDLLPGRRGYVTTTGTFDLGRGFALKFSGEAVSDRAYLQDYGISNKDRLSSRAEITRTRRGEYISGRLIHFHSIRAGEVNSTLPSLVGDLTWTRRIAVPGIGGTATLGLQTHGHRRSSQTDGDDGRDVVRTTLHADWRRDWVLPGGVLAAVQAGVAADLHRVGQDRRFADRIGSHTPQALVELRWPLTRVTASGATEVLEPVLQLAWSRAPNTVPNEDSTLIEFDEGNLFALSRFPGADRRESGTRANLGLGWTRIGPGGWTLAALAGRVLRLTDRGQFTAASGLSGSKSDWLAALNVSAPDGWAFQGRAVFDDRLDLARSELRLRLERQRYGLSTAWIWAEADIAETRPTNTSEWVMDARYQLSDNWAAMASGRYDFTADRATSGGLGLEFANECLRVDLSLSRRFTSSTSVRPTTDFGLSVDLVGFGSGRAAGPVGRACRR